MTMPMYVLRRKPPTLMMGSLFLEENGLLVDCANSELT